MSEHSDKFRGIPRDFRSVLRPVIESILMEQPEDIVKFAADFLEDQVKLRDQEWCASGEMNVHGSPTQNKTSSPNKGSPQPVETQPDILEFENVGNCLGSKKLIHRDAGNTNLNERTFNSSNTDNSSCRKTLSDSSGTGRIKQLMEGNVESINTSQKAPSTDHHINKHSSCLNQEFGVTKRPACKSDQRSEVKVLNELELIGPSRSSVNEQSLTVPTTSNMGDVWFKENLGNDQNIDINERSNVNTVIREISGASKPCTRESEINRSLKKNTEDFLIFKDASPEEPAEFSTSSDLLEKLRCSANDFSQDMISFVSVEDLTSDDNINKQKVDEKGENIQILIKHTESEKKVPHSQVLQEVFIANANDQREWCFQNPKEANHSRAATGHVNISDEIKSENDSKQYSKEEPPKSGNNTSYQQVNTRENKIQDGSFHCPLNAILNEAIKNLDISLTEQKEQNRRHWNAESGTDNPQKFTLRNGNIIESIAEGDNSIIHREITVCNPKEHIIRDLYSRCKLDIAHDDVDEFHSSLNTTVERLKPNTMSWEDCRIQRYQDWIKKNKSSFSQKRNDRELGDQGKQANQNLSEFYQTQNCCFEREKHLTAFAKTYSNSINSCCMKHLKGTENPISESGESKDSEPTFYYQFFDSPPESDDFMEFNNAEEINEMEEENATSENTTFQHSVKFRRLPFTLDQAESSCKNITDNRYEGDEMEMDEAATRGESEPKPSWQNFQFPHSLQNLLHRKKTSSLFRCISMEGDSEMTQRFRESESTETQDSSCENSVRQSKSLTNISTNNKEFLETEETCKSLSENSSTQSIVQSIIQSLSEECSRLDIRRNSNDRLVTEHSIQIEENAYSSENNLRSGSSPLSIKAIDKGTTNPPDLGESSSNECKQRSAGTTNGSSEMQPKEVTRSSNENDSESSEKRFQVESGDYDEDYVIIEDLINQKGFAEGSNSSTVVDTKASDERTNFDSAHSGEGINVLDDNCSKTISKTLESKEKKFVGEGGDMPENGIRKHITERMERLPDHSHVLNHRESGTQVGKRSSDSVLAVKNSSSSEPLSNNDPNVVANSIPGSHVDYNCLLNTQLELLAIMEIFKEQAMEKDAEESNVQDRKISDSDQLPVSNKVSNTSQENIPLNGKFDSSDVFNASTDDIKKPEIITCVHNVSEFDSEKEVSHSSGEMSRNEKYEDGFQPCDGQNTSSHNSSKTKITNVLNDQGDNLNDFSKKEVGKEVEVWPFRDIFKPGKRGSTSSKGKCRWCQSPSSSSESLPMLLADGNNNNQANEKKEVCDDIESVAVEQSCNAIEINSTNIDSDEEKPGAETPQHAGNAEMEVVPTNSTSAVTEATSSNELLLSGGEGTTQRQNGVIHRYFRDVNRFPSMEGDCRCAQFYSLLSYANGTSYNVTVSNSEENEEDSDSGDAEARSENSNSGEQ